MSSSMGKIIPYIMEKHMWLWVKTLVPRSKISGWWMSIPPNKSVLTHHHAWNHQPAYNFPVFLWPFIIPDSNLRGTLAVAEGFVQAQQIHVVQAFEHGHLTTNRGFEWEVAMKKWLKPWENHPDIATVKICSDTLMNISWTLRAQGVFVWDREG